MGEIGVLLVLLALVVLAVPVLLVMVLVSQSRLKQRVASLEDDVGNLRRATVGPSETVAAAAAMQAATSEPDAGPTLAELLRAQAVASAEVPRPSVAATVPPPLPPASVAAPSVIYPAAGETAAPPRARAPAQPDLVTRGLRAVKHWFSVGNVPVKIGMLVLFAGVAALLKYGADQGWFTLPPALRLAGVAAAALGALVFAWRKRDSNRVFALSLQGGAIGVLLLVVFAAFKVFGLIPASGALALSIVLVAGAGVLAVLQDAKALAVFALLAGFLAPIWLSTGSGNHVALFSYYAMLNAAIVGIAWHKSWRILNLLGFVFTFGIGTLWGVMDYRPEKYASTQPFLLLFFVFYLLIPLLFARRQPASRRDLVDGCLVFGMPLVAFSLQAALLDGQRMQLALCALGLGVVYAALAWWLRQRRNYDVLSQAYALLGVGFATLAVPLALTARATTSVFALEGAALVWLGLRQQRWLPQLSGAGLQLAAAVALFVALDSWRGDAQAIANPTFIGMLLLALAGFASAWSYRDAGRKEPALAYYLWGLAWWCGAALREFDQFMPPSWHAMPDAPLAFVALTGWLAAEVHRRHPATALAITTLSGLAAALPLALWQSIEHQQPFAGNGGWAWAVFLLLGVRSLLCLRDSQHRLAGAAQFVWWLVWPLAISLLLAWLPQRVGGLQQGWTAALWVLPWLLVAAISLLRWRWLAAPLGERFDAWRKPLQVVVFAVIGLWWLASLFFVGNAAPLPWVPVLNPLELAQLAALVLALRWLLPGGFRAGAVQPAMVIALAAAAFAWITSVVLHAVHHWGGIAWNDGLLSSSLAQTSLTITWSVLGVLGWVIGSRRGQRMLWLAGAVLMAVVLGKLVLIDRQHLGNLLGIGSFIGYGLLCTVVGYLAPAPPRSAVGNDVEQEGTTA